MDHLIAIGSHRERIEPMLKAFKSAAVTAGVKDSLFRHQLYRQALDWVAFDDEANIRSKCADTIDRLLLDHEPKISGEAKEALVKTCADVVVACRQSCIEFEEQHQ